MIPLPDQPGGERPLPFTPGFAVALSCGATLLTTLIAGAFLSSEAGISPARLGFALLAAFAAMFAVAVPRIPEPPAASLGFVRPPDRAWLAAFWLVPAVLLTSEVDNLVRAVYPLPEGARSSELPGAQQLTELAIVSVLVSPVVSEVFFRGAIQPQLVRAWGAQAGVAAASVLSALPALALLGIWGFAPALSQALLLGALRQCAGSLLPGLALGVTYGLVSVLAALRAFGIPGFDDLEAAHTPWPWLLFAAVTTALGLRATLSLRANPAGTR